MSAVAGVVAVLTVAPPFTAAAAGGGARPAQVRVPVRHGVTFGFTAVPDRIERLPSGTQVVMADDSVPSAGWFHVEGVLLPPGTTLIRYSNVDRASQVGLAPHPGGPLSFWFRAPGAPGSRLRIHLEALDGYGQVLADLGSVDLTTGNEMLPVPAGSGSGRRLVVDSDAQQAWLVEDDGSVTDTFLISGRRVATRSGSDQAGVFRVYSKSGNMKYCDEDGCGTAQYMVRYQRTATSSVGTHSLPLLHGRPAQSADDLGWPLSHGCSRLPLDKAKELFHWASLGTVVVVL